MLIISFTGFFNTVILLGSVQGFIVSSLLFFSKKNRRSNRLLAVLILLISLASFNLYGEYQDWFGSGLLRLIATVLPLVIVMPFGPLIWFYVQSSLDPNFSVNKEKRVHFYPVLIDLVPSLTVIIYFIGIMTNLVKRNPAPWGTFIDDYNVYADIPRWLSITFYVWLSARYLSAYKLKTNNLNGQANNFKWLQQFIYAFMVFQAIWLVYLVPYVIPKYTDWMLDTFNWYPIYIPMAILIYWLGIKGYLVSQQAIPNKKINGNNPLLTSETIGEVTTTLIKVMETDKIYLDPALNLSVLSKATGIAQKTISAVLNQHLQKSFNEFVNQYRVNEFKARILQPEMNNLTIAGIALECGFNSQATFQRTFKELTGQSPSEYRKQPVNQ
jgi:AraC-like DNA-binding protein